MSVFLQAFKHAISTFTTMQSGIWVGLLVTSLREPGQNTQETSDIFGLFLGYSDIFGLFVIHILWKLDKIFEWKKPLSSLTIWYLATI